MGLNQTMRFKSILEEKTRTAIIGEWVDNESKYKRCD